MSYNALMNRVLLDTNILLNGIFVPQSYSRRVIVDLINRKYDGYISEDVLKEADSRLTSVYDETGIDLHSTFNTFISESSLTILPHENAECGRTYGRIKGKGDRLIAASAHRNDLLICTSDVNDFRNAHEYGIEISTPYELSFTGDMSSSDLFPGFLATSREGSIYYHVEAYWHGLCRMSQYDRMYCISDIPNIGGLYLSTKSGDLVYISESGCKVSVSMKEIPKDNEDVQIVVSYSCESGISIYLGYRGKQKSESCNWSHSHYLSATKILIGRGKYGEFGAAMGVRTIAGFPTKLSEKGANNLMGEKLPPHPWDRLDIADVVRNIYC